MAGSDLTADVVRSLLDYNPETGLLRWKTNRGSAGINSLAGSVHHTGYIKIGISRQTVYAHRLAWIHFYGSHPKADLDHKNGIKTDNRIVNLREADKSTNLQNRQNSCLQKQSSSFLGVYKEGKRNFRARIWINGKNVHLGSFPTAELAYAKYVSAKRLLHAGNTL